MKSKSGQADIILITIRIFDFILKATRSNGSRRVT